MGKSLCRVEHDEFWDFTHVVEVTKTSTRVGPDRGENGVTYHIIEGDTVPDAPLCRLQITKGLVRNGWQITYGWEVIEDA